MGKTLIQQARGKGSIRYRTKKQAYWLRVTYPQGEGDAEIIKLLNVPCYDAPVIKIQFKKGIFYNIAPDGVYEGQKIRIGGDQVATGNILKLSDIPNGSSIFNIELHPGQGGKLVRTSGICGKVVKNEPNGVLVLLPSKKEKTFDPRCRATIGIIAGAGRTDKPIMKAGKGVFMHNAIGGRVYPRTSAIKMNAIDHPFGSGRGKRIKSKIAKRNAPPGAKVGLLRPRRTGRKK
jgi:large subunit ribosomal protein L2